MEKNTSLRCIIYARYSSDGQREELPPVSCCGRNARVCHKVSCHKRYDIGIIPSRTDKQRLSLNLSEDIIIRCLSVCEGIIPYDISTAYPGHDFRKLP